MIQDNNLHYYSLLISFKFSREFITYWENVTFNHNFPESTSLVIFMHRWQYNQTFFITLNKSVHRIIFELIKLYFLANAFEIKYNWWVAYQHLKCYFSNFLNKIWNSLVYMFCFVSYAQGFLDCWHYLITNCGRHARLMNRLPVWLIGFS